MQTYCVAPATDGACCLILNIPVQTEIDPVSRWAGLRGILDLTTMTIVPLTPNRFDDFVRLIEALADYERLERPDAAAITRLRADAFASRPRFEAALALDDADRPIAYAIWFETYSSFLAKPTMFLEDLFVLEHARRSGAGGKLFEYVRKLGEQRGCGRMDWNVLDWNTPARDFYDRRNAQWMKQWLLYRLTY